MTKSINLYNRKKEIIGTVVFDDDDYELVSIYPWSMTKAGYAYSPKCNKNTGFWYMHRLITNATSGLVVNHINHNKLDNRKENLEQCEHRENIRKMKKHSGVYWDKSRGKWAATITKDYKKIFLGRFDNITDATKAREVAEIKEWGYAKK